MELSEVQQYLTDNKDTEEVKSYINGLNPITVDSANNYLNTEDGKKLLQPKLDTYHSKGLDSWKTNNLDRVYNERYLKEHPETDEKERARNKRITDLETELANGKKETTREKLTNKVLTQLTEKKYPTSFSELVIADTEEGIGKKIAILDSEILNLVNKMTDERMKGSSYTPPKGSGGTTGVTKEEFNKLGYKERVKLSLENPTLYKELSK